MWWKREPESPESKAQLRRELSDAIAKVQAQLAGGGRPQLLARRPLPGRGDSGVDPWRQLRAELEDELAQLKGALADLGPGDDE